MGASGWTRVGMSVADLVDKIGEQEQEIRRLEAELEEALALLDNLKMRWNP